MRSMKYKMISFLLVLALVFQLTGCQGITEDTGAKPKDILTSLEDSVHEINRDRFLNLLMIDKGSSVYKEYDEILDLDSYTDDAAKCYEAVASNIEIKYDDSSVESDSGIVKVKVTFKIPDWKPVFEDGSLAGADGIIEKLGQADKNKTEMTLRLIKTKDGFKIKNYADLMEIFDFVGCEIAGLAGEPDPSRETEPADPTEPNESSKRKPTKAPTKAPTEPSEPSETKDTSGPGRVSAYGEYKKILEENKSDIEWFEKTVNKASCGLTDFNNDNIPELFFFCQSKSTANYINFYVYTYSPIRGKVSMILVETLVQAGSDTSEFSISRNKDGMLVVYRGYLAKDSSILNYNLYNSTEKMALTYVGNMFCTITPSFEGKDGKEINGNVCNITGVDKYKEHTSVDLDEFRRVEGTILNNTDILISASFQKNYVSSVNKALGKYDNKGLSYADLYNILNM